MAQIVITHQNFEKEVLNSDLPVLVDFWSDWCSPSRMMLPIMEQIAEEYEGKVKIGMINVDDEHGLAMRFRIGGVPTLMVFKNGRPTRQVFGLLSKSQIEKMLE